MGRREWKEFIKNVERYGYKGIGVLDFCPGCGRELLNHVKSTIVALVFMETGDPVKTVAIMKILNPDIGSIELFVPNNKRLAEKLDYRMLVTFFCVKCSSRLERDAGFRETVARRIEDYIESLGSIKQEDGGGDA